MRDVEQRCRMVLRTIVADNKMLSYRRDRAAGCVIVFAKSRRLDLEDNIVIVDIIGISSTAVI